MARNAPRSCSESESWVEHTQLPHSFMSVLQRASYRAWFTLMTAATPFAKAAAQGFGGPLPDIPGTPSPGGSDIREVILRILSFVLNFLALVAVIFIIVAGIRLIVSQGDDTQKDTAKKTILYVILGLIVVLFARIIVAFFTETVPAEL